MEFTVPDTGSDAESSAAGDRDRKRRDAVRACEFPTHAMAAVLPRRTTCASQGHSRRPPQDAGQPLVWVDFAESRDPRRIRPSSCSTTRLGLGGHPVWLRYGALSIADGGALHGHLSSGVISADGKTRAFAKAQGEDRIIAVLGDGTDLGHIVTRAGFVGKWLTKLESPATAFVMMGVSP